MSFPKAPIKRFNEAPTCAPPPGSYDITSSDPSKGPVSFDKSQRFRKQMGEMGTQQNPGNMKPEPSPSLERKLQSLGPKPNSLAMKPGKDLTLTKDLRKQKELEKEIRALIGERGQQDKRLQALEEDLLKSESKLSAAIREKNSLLAIVASLEKKILELTKTNEFLKAKFSEDGVQKKMNSLGIELLKLRNLLNVKKTALVQQEDMEMKLQTFQSFLDNSKEKVVQLEELLMERQPEEKWDHEKLLECIAELGNIAQQGNKYKLDIAHLEEIIEEKNKEIKMFQLKETEMSAQNKDLHEKYKLIENEKEKLSNEHGEKELNMRTKVELLQKNLNLEEQEHQKQKEANKELLGAMDQKLLEFQEEVAKEKRLLEEELRETMEELDKLHMKECTVKKLLKHLEQENKSQAAELAQQEGKLKGKNTEMEKITEAHNNAMAQMQEEQSNTMRKLEDIIAEYEVYKASVNEEMGYLRQEKTTLQDKLTENIKTVQHMTQAMQEVQHVSDKTKEEFARMLLDAQTKLALKDAEIKTVKELSVAQISKLQARLEEQSEELQNQLETERKAISEKVKAEYIESIETWRTLYEDLYSKVKPFQQQLDAYEAEKNALLNEHGAAQEELNKLSDAYAKLLGHQNQKQKIKHVMKLKDENAQLKQEITRLRCQLTKEKQVRGELQEQLNEIKGIQRFDPSKAFKHSMKENVAPKSPFKENNQQQLSCSLMKGNTFTC